MKITQKMYNQYTNALLKACEELAKSNRACMVCTQAETCSKRQSEATNCTLHICNSFLNKAVQK